MKTIKMFFVIFLILSVSVMLTISASQAKGMGKNPGKGKMAHASVVCTVVGEDDPSVDAANIQAAVDSCDEVLLSGTFDFGDANILAPVAGDLDTVYITKNVIIRSEDPANKAVIKGGYRSLLVGLPPRTVSYLYDEDEAGADFTDAIPANVKIKDIRFERPLLSAIRVVATTGLEISGCEFFDARPLAWAGFGGQPTVKLIHIGYYNWFGNAVPGTITGDILIDNNVVDGNAKRYMPGTQPPEAVGPWNSRYWDGVMGPIALNSSYVTVDDVQINLPLETDNVTITNNTLTNWFYFGLYELGTYGNILIDNNIITSMADDGLGRFGRGCLEIDEYGWSTPGEADPSQASHTVSNNTLQHFYSSAPVLRFTGTNGLITANTLIADTYGNSGLAMNIENGSQNNTISYNIFEGNAVLGLLLGNVTDNTVKNNDFSNIAVAPYAYIQVGFNGWYCSGNTISNNIIGPPTGNSAGIWVQGSSEKVINNTFPGDYPGWEYDPETGDYGGPGGVMLGGVSYDCIEVALKDEGGSQGFDLCDQVMDLPDYQPLRYWIFFTQDDVQPDPFYAYLGYYCVYKTDGAFGYYNWGRLGFDDKFGEDNPTTAYMFQRSEDTLAVWGPINFSNRWLFQLSWIEPGLVSDTMLPLPGGGTYPDPDSGTPLIVLKNNKVPGYEKCMRAPDEVIESLQQIETAQPPRDPLPEE